MDSFSNTNHTNQTNTLITTDYADNMDSFSNTNRTNQTNTSITISWEYIIREIRVIRVRKISLLSSALASCGFDLHARITRNSLILD